MKKIRKQTLYFLQHSTMGYCGNSPFFWRNGGNGYTIRIDDAAKFTAKEANEIIRSTRGTHKFIKHSVTKIEKLSFRTVCIQDIRKCPLTKN